MLYELEQHRLSAYEVPVLLHAQALMDELLRVSILPGIMAERLSLTREDVAAAVRRGMGR